MIDIVNIGPDGLKLFELEFKKHPETFLKVHHPSCGHCKAMENDWEDLENELKNNYNGDVGVFNIHADALSNTTFISALQGIHGYPTIMAIKNDEPMQYEGSRNKDDMLKFCLENLDLKKTEKSYEGSKRKKSKK